MIAHLSGKVIARAERSIVVDVGGVGYGVLVSEMTINTLAVDEVVSIHVYTHVREQTLELYGFLAPAEQQIFQLLIGVSGIGPKAALGILSVADTATLSSAIMHDDVGVLTQVSGIGKKTAQRVVMELKSKVTAVMGEASVAHSVDIDALEALCTMGYRVGEAREALAVAGADVTDISDKVRAALKVLAK